METNLYFKKLQLGATLINTFLSGMEMVGGKWKTYIGVGLEFPWAIGYSLLPGIAFILPVNGVKQSLQ